MSFLFETFLLNLDNLTANFQITTTFLCKDKYKSINPQVMELVYPLEVIPIHNTKLAEITQMRTINYCNQKICQSSDYFSFKICV